jgi:NAD(P)H-flavin reductase
MVRDAVQRATGLRALLFFGNRSPVSCIPYRAELESYGMYGIEVVHVFEIAEDGWAGGVGYITPAIVGQRADVNADLFVTAGPPAMVAAMESCMDALEVPADRRLIERFSGYA